MNKKFYSLDIAKFAFTLMVAVYHFLGLYQVRARGGFIAVEFFFILSGFFLMGQYETKEEKIIPAQYIWRKVKKFFPHYLFSFFVLFLYRNIVEWGNSFATILRNFLHQMPEIFMILGTIISDEKAPFYYNSMTWYISVLLVVGYILWAFLKGHKSAVIAAAPVTVFWIYAYMYYTLGTTSNWRTHVFAVFNYGMLRGVAGMLLGILIYQAYVYVFPMLGNGKKWGGGTPLLFIGSVVLAVSYFASYKWFHRASFFYIACFAIGILFLITGEGTSRKAFAKPVISIANWMSGISFAVYLNHYFIFYVLRHFIPVYHHWVIPVYLAVLIVYSMLTSKFVGFVKKLSGSLAKGHG